MKVGFKPEVKYDVRSQAGKSLQSKGSYPKILANLSNFKAAIRGNDWPIVRAEGTDSRRKDHADGWRFGTLPTGNTAPLARSKII